MNVLRRDGRLPAARPTDATLACLATSGACLGVGIAGYFLHPEATAVALFPALLLVAAFYLTYGLAEWLVAWAWGTVVRRLREPTRWRQRRPSHPQARPGSFFDRRLALPADDTMGRRYVHHKLVHRSIVAKSSPFVPSPEYAFRRSQSAC